MAKDKKKKMDELINTIICGDCLDVMRDMPDDSVDLVLTDPPYGIGAANYKRGGTQHGHSCAKSKEYGLRDWDDKPMTPEQRDECLRIGVDQVFFGGNYFILPPSSCWVVWDKDNGSNGYADCELIWTSFKSAVRLVKWKWHGMLQENMACKEVRNHPTQKPLGVMMWILERYSKPTDLIFDPFCGSGTACVAAKRLGRRWIGVDISEGYCQIARDRLAAESKGVTVKEMKRGQGGLFEE